MYELGNVFRKEATMLNTKRLEIALVLGVILGMPANPIAQESRKEISKPSIQVTASDADLEDQEFAGFIETLRRDLLKMSDCKGQVTVTRDHGRANWIKYNLTVVGKRTIVDGKEGLSPFENTWGAAQVTNPVQYEKLMSFIRRSLDCAESEP
jgi:hypothetical protein